MHKLLLTLSLGVISEPLQNSRLGLSWTLLGQHLHVGVRNKKLHRIAERLALCINHAKVTQVQLYRMQPLGEGAPAESLYGTGVLGNLRRNAASEL